MRFMIGWLRIDTKQGTKMRSIFKFSVLVFLCLSMVSCSSTVIKPENCPASFEDFAYGGSRTNHETISIPADWQKEDEIPFKLDELSWLKIALIRKVNNETEIWLKEPDSNLYSDGESENYKYYIYSVKKKDWRIVSAVVPDTNAFAMRLFLSEDGSIWAQNFWDLRNSTGNSSYYQKYPMLSRFNDIKQMFEFIPETQGINAFKGLSWNKMIFVDNVFWVFAQTDSIYSFDPATSEVERHLDIPGLEIQYVASSQDHKSIFVQVTKNDMSFSVVEGEYLQYVIDENRLIPLSISSNKWPASGSILVDHSGNLWLSAVGWRTPEGTWQLLYPNPNRFFWKMQVEDDYSFALPHIIVESSDGRLWFNSIKGMAWLDPISMQGCWFTTNGASNVMEDLNHNLWMITDGILYMLPIEK